MGSMCKRVVLIVGHRSLFISSGARRLGRWGRLKGRAGRRVRRWSLGSRRRIILIIRCPFSFGIRCGLVYYYNSASDSRWVIYRLMPQ